MSHCRVSLMLDKLASVDGWRRSPTKTASPPEPQIPKCSESTSLSSPLPDTPSPLSALPARVYQTQLRITTINQDMLAAVVQSHHPSHQVQSQDHRRPRSVAARVTRAWPATWKRAAWKIGKRTGVGGLMRRRDGRMEGACAAVMGDMDGRRGGYGMLVLVVGVGGGGFVNLLAFNDTGGRSSL